MKHNILDDDWLKAQLAVDHLNDNDFSDSTMQLIGKQRQPTPWYIHFFSGAIVCSLCYILITLLLSVFSNIPIEKEPLIDIQWSDLFIGIQVDAIYIVAIALTFALTWLIEELDLL